MSSEQRRKLREIIEEINFRFLLRQPFAILKIIAVGLLWQSRGSGQQRV